jgi:hypothetical protein
MIEARLDKLVDGKARSSDRLEAYLKHDGVEMIAPHRKEPLTPEDATG